MRNVFQVVMIVTLVLVSGSRVSAEKRSIFQTKHNLSVTGPGPIKARSETRVCIFCHTSHGASAEGPLWNHQTSLASSYKTYTRETLKAVAFQPNGATKLCLSCHDGTVAIGAVLGHGGEIVVDNTGTDGTLSSKRSSFLGMDLSGTHPVSVPYGQDAAIKSKHLNWPPNDPEGKVGPDAHGFVQCTSCHDPHGGRSSKLPMWRKETFSAVCVVCHDY